MTRALRAAVLMFALVITAPAAALCDPSPQPYLGQGVRIYEFYGDKLGFIQILPPPHVSFSSGQSAVPGDGTSIANAIEIRPSNILNNIGWIDAYMALHSCNGNGHWQGTSQKSQADSAGTDPLTYTIVHARCTQGSSERDFFFDTTGMLIKGPNGQNTLYIDASQLHHYGASPAPSSPMPKR